MTKTRRLLARSSTVTAKSEIQTRAPPFTPAAYGQPTHHSRDDAPHVRTRHVCPAVQCVVTSPL
jgi:hypothetical protein